MSKIIPLPQETIDKIYNFNSKWEELMHELGTLKLTQLETEARELYLKQHYIDLQDIKNKIFSDLEQKYGKGKVNLEQKSYISK
jgi:hypothetical protein